MGAICIALPGSFHPSSASTAAIPIASLSPINVCWRCKTLTISAEEFIRRFLLHTLPPGFQRIRYFGFLANRFRQEKLALCRQLLHGDRSDLLPSAIACRELREALSQPLLPRCPECQLGSMLRILVLPAYRWPLIAPPDSS